MAQHHRHGGKITSAHSTVTDASVVVVDAAVKLAEVTKVALGIIKMKKNRARRMKFKEVVAGWEVSVCGNTSVQTIYIHTTDKPAVKAALEHLFD